MWCSPFVGRQLCRIAWKHGLSHTLLLLLLKLITHCLCLHPLFSLHKYSASTDECNWVQYFSTWSNIYTTDLYTLPYQTPFCQTDICNKTKPKKLMDYWRESSTFQLSISASDIVGEHTLLGCQRNVLVIVLIPSPLELIKTLFPLIEWRIDWGRREQHESTRQGKLILWNYFYFLNTLERLHGNIFSVTKLKHWWTFIFS